MSKLSRFFIWVILIGLAFIAGTHLYRAYEKHVEQLQAQEPPATQTFNRVPVRYEPPEPEVPVYKKYEDRQQEIYLEDQPLDEQQSEEQARQTIKSILDDYKEDEQIQSFYTDIVQKTGKDIKLDELSGENLGDILKQHPEIQDVISQHAKDPAFAQKMQEILSNPQFAQSVAILQQKNKNIQRK